MLVYLDVCVHVCNQMCLFAGSVYTVPRLNTALETNKGTSSWEKLILLSAVIIFLKFFFFLSMYGILQNFTPSTLTCSSIMPLLWFCLCSHFWVRLLHSWLPWVLTPTSLLPFYIVPEPEVSELWYGLFVEAGIPSVCQSLYFVQLFPVMVSMSCKEMLFWRRSCGHP